MSDVNAKPAVAAGGNEAKPPKPKRMRSPAYPFIDLKSAVERAREFYDKERRNPANLLIAVKHWDYKPKSSGGIQTAAALKAFGLLKDSGAKDGRAVQLTEDALRILLDNREGSTEREALIKKAALLPKIHATLWRRYGNDLPSNDTLTHELLFTYRFNENAVSDFIKEYKTTISYAKLNTTDTLSEEEEDSDEVEGDEAMEMLGMVEAKPLHPGSPAGAQKRSIPPTANVRPLGNAIPVSKDCVMNVMAAGEVTQQGIEQLVAYLNLIKGSFPRETN